MRRLGHRQQGVLELLVKFGSWRAHLPGWVWGDISSTEQILESLLKYDLVVKTEGDKYKPTGKARQLVRKGS